MLYLSLETIKFILAKFKEKILNYNIIEYTISDFETVIALDDDLILYIKIEQIKTVSPMNYKEIFEERIVNSSFILDQNNIYFSLSIEEITYNSIFKYNHSSFIKEIEKLLEIKYLSLDIRYFKYKGLQGNEIIKIDKLLPSLKYKERIKSWEGVTYYYIIMEFFNPNNLEKQIAIIYTTQKPISHMTKKCQEWIKKGLEHGEFRTKNLNRLFKFFKELPGKTRQYKLENFLRYAIVEKKIKIKKLAYLDADNILENFLLGKLKNLEWSTYKRPINRWKTEEMIFNVVKKAYKEFNVISQHRPFFLKTDIGGQMSYDIFISKLNIAIEYQGEQHFTPIDFFGGEMGYEKTIQRDILKKDLSLENGVKLIYINYWEDINSNLIINKIKETLSKPKE